jgi:P-type Mg2+ transporter
VGSRQQRSRGGRAQPARPGRPESQPPGVAEYVKRDELPLDFERRRVSVLAEGAEGVQVVTKGAPESVLPLCTHVEQHGCLVPLDDTSGRQAQTTFERLSREEYHLLAIARRPVPPGQAALAAEDERERVLCGFVAFLDPPDPSTPATISALRASGIAIKILTGDGELVTRTICAQVGLHEQARARD